MEKRVLNHITFYLHSSPRINIIFTIRICFDYQKEFHDHLFCACIYLNTETRESRLETLKLTHIITYDDIRLMTFATYDVQIVVIDCKRFQIPFVACGENFDSKATKPSSKSTIMSTLC